MAQVNKAVESVYTHNGAKAKKISPWFELRRSVMACLLWEDTFYEKGEAIADRIQNLIKVVDPELVANLAIEAREDMKLRHIPLFIVKVMAGLDSHKHLVATVLERIIQRPDELSEYLALYWADGKRPISNQSRRGLAKAFTKFNEYQLAKYRGDGKEIKLKDVMKLVRPKPQNDEQAKLWKKLLDNNLETPDTWEVAMSKNPGSKVYEWTRLLTENKLGALALIRNLRNMLQAGVNKQLIIEALTKMNIERVLPFRFITAAKMAPDLEPALEVAMLKCLGEHSKIQGKTGLLIDVSGSMSNAISKPSNFRNDFRMNVTSRLDGAVALAILLREICEDVEIFSFSRKLVKIPPRRGFALADAIRNSQPHLATFLGASVNAIYGEKNKQYFKGNGTGSFIGQGLNLDRLIVITDEQSDDPVPDPKSTGFIINVATYKYGVGYGPWNHCDGWSESVIKWIQAVESLEQ